MTLSRRHLLHRLTASGLAMNILANAPNGFLSSPAIAQTKNNTTRLIGFPLMVASPFTAEYTIANQLSEKLYASNNFYSRKKNNNILQPRVMAFDSYPSLFKKTAFSKASSIIVPLEFFSPHFETINRTNFLNEGFQVMAVIKPAPIFLIARGNIKYFSSLFQRRTSRPTNNILLSQLLDTLLRNRYKKITPDITETTTTSLKNRTTINPSPTIVPDGDETNPDSQPADSQTANTQPTDTQPTNTQTANDKSSEAGETFDGFFDDDTPPYPDYEHLVGQYNHDAELLHQFVTRRIDWFLSFGFFENHIGKRFLRQTGGRVFPLPYDSFGEDFGKSTSHFITGEVKTIKGKFYFSLPMVWMVRGNDLLVKGINRRLRRWQHNLFIPRTTTQTRPAVIVVWNGIAFDHLIYHNALL
ncbi:MAG: hypothetical protein ACR2NY_06850 [Alphaproteobacteria bacterium]